MLLYPGDPAVNITEEKAISNGDGLNLSLITFGSHTGTHIDAPKHFFDDGLTVDRLPLEYFIGKTKVFSLEDKDEITASDLKELDIQRDDKILLKTKNSSMLSQKQFYKDFTYLTPEAAGYLAEVGIKTLGFDYLSVEKYGSVTSKVHDTLLSHNIIIIEGLVLGSIKQGEYEMTALPLKIKNGDGSPARVILMELYDEERNKPI